MVICIRKCNDHYCNFNKDCNCISDEAWERCAEETLQWLSDNIPDDSWKYGNKMYFEVED